MKKHQSQNDDSMFKGASPQIFRNAEQLRNNMTIAEKLLWEELKGKKFNGLKFRRQHPIQSYIADFYCHKLKLIIEIDGGYHNSEKQIENDNERTEILEFNGLEVIRFSNKEVVNNLNYVLSKIESYL